MEGVNSTFGKVLLATTALVFAGSLALAASQHGKLSPTQQLARAKRITRHAFEQHMPGVIFDRKHGTPMAIRLPLSFGKKGTQSKGAEFQGGKGFSNFSKSKNALFLTWFGWFAGENRISFNSSFSYCLSYNSAYTQCYNYEYLYHSSQIDIRQSAAQPFTKVATASSIALAVEAYSGTGTAKAAIYDSDAYGRPRTPIAGASGTFIPPTFSTLCCEVTTVAFPPVSLKKDKKYWLIVSESGGRLVWFGQSSDFTHYPTGEDYQASEKVHYKSCYNSMHTSCTSGTYHTGTGGWIHTSSFSFDEQQAAFAVVANAAR